MYCKKSQHVKPHEDLADFIYENPKNAKEGLKEDVCDYLLEVVDRVKELIPIKDLNIEDVWVVGSILGYQYTEKSDIDVHFIVDIKGYAEDHGFEEDELNDLLRFMFWYLNEKNYYEINNHEIEFYWQDKVGKISTPACYSLCKDKMIKYPEVPEFNEEAVALGKKDAVLYAKVLDGLIAKGNKTGAKEWWSNLKDLRTDSIEKEGPNSYGNILYKILRDWGYLEKAIRFSEQFIKGE